MNWFEKCIHALSGTMAEPTMYGIFHLVSLAIMVGLIIFLCIKCRNCSDKTFRIIVGVVWGIMVLFEIYKQLEFSFEYDDVTGVATWDYQWYAFPYQLCSTPLYLLPLIAFCREGKFRDAITAFIGSFALFGGLATMFFPATVFIETIGINIQTMVHHGLQVTIGIFVLVHQRQKLNIKYFVKGIYVYIVVIAIAMGLNYLMHELITESFNMFYINKWDDCDLPLVGDVIKPNVPYIVFLLIYVIGFVVIAFAIFMIVYGIIKLCQRKYAEKGLYSYQKQQLNEKDRVYSYQKQQAKEKDRVYSYQKQQEKEKDRIYSYQKKK